VTQPDATSETFSRTEYIDFTKEGNGYVPMLRAVGQAIADGRTEHALHPISASISVLDTMEEIVRQMKGLQGV